MSETSTPYTPASTSTTVAGNETVSLADEIKKYDTAKLIEFLKGQEDLGLSESALKILENEEVNGRTFFKITKEELERHGMKLGPATALVDFARECKEKKLRSFSSYKTKKELSEVLRKYGIDSNEITKIPPFEPEPVEIDDEDEELEQCITEIKRRMGIIGSATGRNEAFEVVGEEASGRVDYAIKKVIDVVNEELIAITEGKQKDLVAGFMQNIMQLESSHHTNTRKRKASVAFDDEFDYLYGIVTTASDWYFLMYTPERIYCSKDDYHIALNEKIMKDDAELRRGVKKVMGVIVGLLKDRVEVDDSPDTNSVRPKTHIFLRVVKLEQDIDELKKELESKKNRKFQEKCILIAQVLLGEEPIVEYRPSFMRGLELDAFFRHHRMALEVQGAQHRLHNTSWYKDVKKLEDIVDRDRKKRTLCQLNGIYLLEVWYDENPEITIPQKIYKFKECIDRKDFNLD